MTTSPFHRLPAASLQTKATAEVKLTDGQHEFRVVATDEAGNASTATLPVWVDLEAPVVQVDSWPKGRLDEDVGLSGGDRQ